MKLGNIQYPKELYILQLVSVFCANISICFLDRRKIRSDFSIDCSNLQDSEDFKDSYNYNVEW